MYSVNSKDIRHLIKDWEEALSFYFNFKKLGNPFNKGWMYWPCHLLDIIYYLDTIDWSDKTHAIKTSSREDVKKYQRG